MIDLARVYFPPDLWDASGMPYEPRTVARAHQSAALERIRKRPSTPCPADVFAHLMEYGAGKSKVVCDEFGERELAGDLQDLAVVAGAGSYRNWDRDKSAAQPSEFHRHMSDDLNDRLRVGTWVTGAGVTHQRALEKFITDVDPKRPRAFVVNIEALSTVPRAREMLREFLRPRNVNTWGRRAMLVDDESTNIKTWESKRTEFMCSVAGLAVARRILTGLVTPNSPMDLFSQFWFLDWRILRQRSYYSYRSRYAVTKRSTFLRTEDLIARLRTVPGLTTVPDGRDAMLRVLEAAHRMRRGEVTELIVDFKNVAELNGFINPYSYRVLKEDCMDLPPKIYMPLREVAMTDEQRRIYKDIRANAMAKLEDGSHVVALRVITQMLRLQQLLVGHITDEDGNEHDVPERRTNDILEVLGEHSGKAILWVPFLRTLSKLKARLEEEFGAGCAAEFSGRNTTTRLDEESRWLSDPTCRFMLSTKAGSKGNTWLPGTLEIFVANDYNLEDRLNAEDRPHRIGQQHPVAIVDYVCPGTVEEKVVPALRGKIDIASAIRGEG